MKNPLTGTAIAGGKSSSGRERVEHDFYATDPQSVQALLNAHTFKHTGSVLEPCVGQGHIMQVIRPLFTQQTAIDIVDRGFPNTLVADFLTHDFHGEKFDAVITNPPYKLAEQFIRKSLQLLTPNGCVAMFLKLTFLESQSRQALFKSTPLKYVYVFSARQQVMRNGEPLNEEGKRWASTIAFAWLVWEAGYQGEPTIKWL